MNWFTIFIEKPDKRLAEQCQTNCAGQFILFDGESSVEQVLSKGVAASLQCYEVQIFRGKQLGRHFHTFKNGKVECTYCGQAHLGLD